MTISVSCPNPDCGASFSVPAEYAGRRGRCRRCGATVPIPRAPESAPVPAAAGAGPELPPALVSTLASSPSHPSSRPRTPPKDLPEQFGRFRILARLGRGGMGSVYKVFDSSLHRQVALKIPHLNSDDGPAILERFYREARAAATFDHPNLCPVFTVDQVDGVHYLTMPLLDGQPLSKRFEGRHPLPQRPVAALVRMLALAIEEAHRRGVVHRDLKPSNIMADRQRTLVIVDFGLSLRSGWLDPGYHGALPLEGDERITQAGSILGTPAYMAPEQVTGAVDAIGPTSDIYSLGVILYELLTGQPPFEGPVAVVLGLIRVADPPRPSTLRPDLKPSLEAICLKAMAKQPGARFASMAEFAASLKVYLDHGEFTQAGLVPAALLKPVVPDDDVPTLEERQSVERLLAGSSTEPDPVRRPTWASSRAKVLGFWPRGWRRPRDLIVVSSLGVIAATLLVVRSREFGSWSKVQPPYRRGPSQQPREPPKRPGLPLSNPTRSPGAAAARRISIKVERRIEWPGNHIFHTAFSPDGKLYLGGGDSGSLRIWEVASGNEVVELPVPVGMFTPDGQHVVGHKGDKTLFVFDLGPAAKAAKLPGNPRPVLSREEDKTFLWFMVEGQSFAEEEVRTWDSDAAVSSLAISPDGKQIVSGHADGSVRLWDYATGKELWKVAGHHAPADVQFSPDGAQILSVSTDKTVRLSDVATGSELRTFRGLEDVTPREGHDLVVQAFFLQGGRQVAGYIWGKPTKLLVWHAADGALANQLDIDGDPSKEIAISPDGGWFLTSHVAGIVRLHELATGKDFRLPSMNGVSVPRAPNFSRDGSFVVAGSHRGWVYLWRLQK